MNKHFHDSRYYLSRAVEHARLGVTESLEPLVTRVRSRVGRDAEVEPKSTRVDRVREDVTALERSAETRVRQAVGAARARVDRDGSSEADSER
ncbi:hypothetical protein [Natrinema sp. 1APR25-10V2]|uniref:DUF7553 family protein n=1 Tax=Natrinema sp. 1APR25-10V2 TaxID=2951081 RepID=UPI002876B893|nr:hypothetical protein [Natrinema sp. 1APR25-10V2]MDS0474826.1 hypothetical protein [Natrinema sp. 1APR25-10V2]